MTSIRRFLIIIILSVLCLTNFIAALQGYRDSLNAVDRIEEQQLREKAHSLMKLAAQPGKLPDNLFGDDILYQVWHKTGLQTKSDNAPDSPFFEEAPGFHFKTYQGHQWLLYRMEVHDLAIQIVVASKHQVYSSLTEEVLIRTILPIIWVLPIVGILVWLIVHIGLKPLRRMATRLDSRSADDFSALVSDDYTEELQPITRALDGLFRRLGNAFEREKRFSADAAHELRTPLSALKIDLHNLSKSRDDNELLASLKRTANRMEHSIEQLLDQHKVSVDADNHSVETINLYSAVQEVIVESYDQLVMKDQDIGLEGADCDINGRSSSIAILLRNLIDNASKYTPAKGTIQVTVAQQGERVSLLVEDSGPGVPEEEYPRMLDRFYRIGGDHNASNVHGSGLGLSIVSDIIRAHEADIVFTRSSSLGGLAVDISFPVAGSIDK